MTFRIIMMVAMLGVSGCSTLGGASGSNASKTGGLLGRIGGSGGSQSATIIAAMDGGLIKGSIGATLDSEERTSALEAEYRALEYTPGGQAVTWRGKSGRYGEVTAAQAYRVGSQDCRQYSHTVYQGGPLGTARGTACRNPDGSWTPLT